MLFQAHVFMFLCETYKNMNERVGLGDLVKNTITVLFLP